MGEKKRNSNGLESNTHRSNTLVETLSVLCARQGLFEAS